MKALLALPSKALNVELKVHGFKFYTRGELTQDSFYLIDGIASDGSVTRQIDMEADAQEALHSYRKRLPRISRITFTQRNAEKNGIWEVCRVQRIWGTSSGRPIFLETDKGLIKIPPKPDDYSVNSLALLFHDKRALAS